MKDNQGREIGAKKSPQPRAMSERLFPTPALSGSGSTVGSIALQGSLSARLYPSSRLAFTLNFYIKRRFHERVKLFLPFQSFRTTAHGSRYPAPEDPVFTARMKKQETALTGLSPVFCILPTHMKLRAETIFH
jgi:hypothetical protein